MRCGNFEIDLGDKEIKKVGSEEGSTERVFIDRDVVWYQKAVTYHTHGFATYEVITNYPSDFPVEKYKKRFEEIESMIEQLDDEDSDITKFDVEEAIEQLFEDVISETVDEDALVEEAVDVATKVIKERYGADCDPEWRVEHEYYGPIYVEGGCCIDTEDGEDCKVVKFTVTIATFKNLYGNEVYTYFHPTEDDVELEEVEDKY